MEKWITCQLGDLITFQRGHDLPKTQMCGGEYPVVGSNGIIGYHNEYTTEEPSITIGRSGNVGKPFLYKGKSWSHNTSLYIKEFKGVDPIFIYYFLQTLDLGNYAGGSAVPTLNRNHIHTLEVTVPSDIHVQCQIASILSVLDTQIENNSAINQNLAEQRMALFKSWFIRFDPFMGQRPNSWKIIQFSDFLIERKEKSNDPDIPLYSITDTGIYPREKKFNKKLSAKTTFNKVLYKNDLAFGMSREILNWGVMKDTVGAVSSAYNVYSVNNGISSVYLELFMKSKIGTFRDLIRPATREGQSIDKGCLMNKIIYYPDETILERYLIFDSIFENKMSVIQKETNALQELRDTLLPKLMSGELDVSGVDI